MGSAFLNIVEGPDIDDAGERVTFGAQSFAALDLPVPTDFTIPGSRRQILIDVGDGAVMFTVAASDGVEPDVQLGSAALTRLHLRSPPSASAHVTTTVLSSGELVETTMLRRGAQVAVVAPHGGFIERATDTQARRVSSDERLLANVWICRGRAGDAFRRWHITSDDLSEHSFPGLEALLATRHDYAVSFHGFDAHDGLDVIVGGRVDHTIKERVQHRLEPRLSSLFRRRAAVLLATSTRGNAVVRVHVAKREAEQPDRGVAGRGQVAKRPGIMTVARGPIPALASRERRRPHILMSGADCPRLRQPGAHATAVGVGDGQSDASADVPVGRGRRFA